MTTVTKILERLAKNNLKTNPLKCEWAVKERDFLGYIMTPRSVKPMPNKVKALLRLSPAKNKKQLRSLESIYTIVCGHDGRMSWHL